MLVLTCKFDEGIMIGDDIRIMVVDIGNGKVKLGISAPKQVSVHRDKIYNDIKSGKPYVKS